MTVAEIRTEVRQIIQQISSSNSNVSDSSILGWINACTMHLCSIIATLPKDEFTLVAANTLTLDKSLIKVDFASIYDPIESQYYPLTTIDYVNFVRKYPGYQNEPSQRPSMLVRKSDTEWDMWPTPDATWLGRNVVIVGTAVPTALTSDSEEPPVARPMHPAYPHFCAWKAYLLLNNPERAAAEYATFDALKKIYMQATTSTTGNLLSFKF